MAITDRRGRSVSAVDAPVSGDPNPGLAVKTPCLCATTGNIALSGLQTVDGVPLAEGDRVLVTEQSDATTNGPYNASSGNWTRTIDCRSNDQIASGMEVFVNLGDINGGQSFTLTTPDPIAFDSSALTFENIAGISVGAVTGTIYAAPFGVAADGSDIGPGLQRALAAALAQGGKTVVLPPGLLVQATPAFLNLWGPPGTLTVPGLKIRGAGRNVTMIDTRVANNYAIQVNPEWQRGFKALAGIAAASGGSLATATHYVLITITDPSGNEINLGALPRSLAVVSPGQITVKLPALNPGYSYNIYCDTAATPAHYAVVNGADARRLSGGVTVQLTAIGSAHTVPTDKFAIWQEVDISDLAFTNSANTPGATALLLFKAAYSEITRCLFSGLTGDGIHAPAYTGDADGSFNCTVSRCKFDSIAGWGIDAAGAVLELSNFTVRDSVFNLCGTLPSNRNIAVTISAINNSATSLVTTSANHNLQSRDQVLIGAVTGMALAAGWYRVGTVPSPTTFNLLDLNGNAIDTTALGAYTANSGNVALNWRPPVWDPVAQKTAGSGGFGWMGLIGSLINSNFTQCKNVSFYASENGSSDNLTIEQVDFENTYGKAAYIGALTGGRWLGGEILSAAALGPTIAGVQLGTGFSAGGVRNFIIDGIKVRSDVTPCTAFEQFQNIAIGSSFVDSVRVRNTTWQVYDAAGQKRFDGFRFDAISGQAKFSISATNIALLSDVGYGSAIPLKLAATGEWVTYRVPNGGVAATGIGGLAAATQYYFYLWNTVGALLPLSPAIEVSATAPATDTAEGYAIKAGDSTRTYIGTWTTDGAGNFQPAGNGSSQYPPTGLVPHAVTRAMLSQGTALSVIGNASNATADVADIAAASDNTVFRRSGSAIGFGSIDLSQANTVGASILGVANGGSGRASLTAHGVLLGNGTSGINATSAGSTGAVLVGQNASDPVFSNQPQLGSPGATLGTLGFANLTSGVITVSPPTGALGSVTNTLQAAADTFVYRATADTLTNKTISGASNTLTARWGNDISGLGSGVATAGAINVGTAGSFVVNGGALGTPSSATLTNATGLPTTGLTGTLQAAQEPAHTGDMTNTAGSLATTVKGINGVDQTVGWTTYTPTVSSQGGALTTASATGRYRQIGKTYIVTVTVLVTTAGTGTGYLQASLPGGVTAAAATYLGAAQESNVSGKAGSAQITSGATIIKAVDSTGVTFIANGANVTMTCTFEST